MDSGAFNKSVVNCAQNFNYILEL